MSKTHMVVLGFLHEAPMYGYRIGQIVESRQFQVWEGIRIASVYKAMQALESKGYISGQQVTEGNNPPRTVYSINDKGVKYLTKLVTDHLAKSVENGHEFMLGLSFSRLLFTRRQFHKFITSRLQAIRNMQNDNFAPACDELIRKKKLPIIHRHMVKIGDGWAKVEQEALQELLDKLDNPEYDDFFKE
jgi:DNA-binding PadR family transcriptional regulator